MYRLILVPLDGSRFGEFALPLAVHLSRKTGARIHLVTVQELLPATTPIGWQNATRDWARGYLEAMAERLRPDTGGEVTTRFRSGHAADELLEEAKDVDLTVMSTHGRGMLSRAWLGSVADAFVRHVNRPVLLVRPDADEGEEELPAVDLNTEWTITKMLLPLDGTPVSEAIIRHATELGSLFGAAYHLVRVVPLPMEFSSSYPPDMIQMNKQYLADSEEAARGYLEGHAQGLRSRGFAVDTAVVLGAQPAHGILTEAASSGSDLFAISAHSRGGLTRVLLGSTSDKVLRGAHEPVLMYRHAD
jgi:nucleotide-binding universal stress UspA family protein